MRLLSFQRLRTAILLFVLVFIAAGCSLVRLGYSNGESISYYWLNNYLDFDQSQQVFVRREIDALFDWHRRTQLKDYVQLLQQTQQRIQGPPLKEEEVREKEEWMRQSLLRIVDRILPAAAGLSLMLKPEQIAHLERKFAASNDKFRKEESISQDRARQQQARYKRVMKIAEYWFGSFSPEQEMRIRAASDARPLDVALRLEERRARQQALLALLRRIQQEKPPQPVVLGMLKDFVAADLDHHGNPEHRAYFAANRAAGLHLVTVIVNEATPAQKKHLIDRAQQWIDDFRAAQPR